MSRKSEDIKEYIQYGICILCVLGAMVMSFLAMYIDPTGEIHDSILWLIAQVLVFCGSLMGINSLHNVHVKKIDQKINEVNLQTPNDTHKPTSVSQDNKL
jgi:hypothetical protein